MKEHVCFVCGSEKESLNVSKNIEKDEFESDLENELEEDEDCKETEFFRSGSNSKNQSFASCKNLKFRRIQTTLFNSVLQVNPSYDPEDGVTEIPVELCETCKTNVYNIWKICSEIRRLERKLNGISENILDSVISCVVDYCLSYNDGNDDSVENCKIDFQNKKINMKTLDKQLPKESVGRKVYKKWRSKFCKAFAAKLKVKNSDTINPDVVSHADTYEEDQNLDNYSHLNTANEENLVENTKTDDDFCLEEGEKWTGMEDPESFQPKDQNNSHQASYSEDKMQNMDDLLIVNTDVINTMTCVLDNKSQPQESNNSLTNASTSDKVDNKNEFNAATYRNPTDESLPKTINKDPNCKMKIKKSTREKYASEEQEQDSIIDKSYNCKTCGHKFKRMARLKEHLDSFHNQDNKVNFRFRCPECSGGFRLKQHLEYHLTNSHKDKRLEYEWCKCKTLIKKAENHLCKVFSKTCKRCNQSFISLLAYKHHRKRDCKVVGKKGSKDFKCGLCSKVFNRKQGLIYHQKTHTGEKNFSCEICKKLFMSKHQLLIHQRIHSGEKPYICESCGDNFSSLPGLLSHTKTHLKVKPHKCNVCEKSFRSQGHLNTHKVIHTGEKPYSCPICQKAFNRKENLRSHEYTHAINKPHKCSLCPGISYGRASLLRNHMASMHSTFKPSRKVNPPEKVQSSLISIKQNTPIVFENSQTITTIPTSSRSIIPKLESRTSFQLARSNSLPNPIGPVVLRSALQLGGQKSTFFLRPTQYLVLKTVPSSKVTSVSPQK